MYFIPNICEQVNKTTYSNHYNLIKLKCDWNKYVDATANPELLEQRLQAFRKNRAKSDNRTTLAPSDVENRFGIEFVPSSVKSDDPRYQTIRSKLFTNMRLRTVSFRQLNIRSIDVAAFDDKCCRKDLERLDLTGNHLSRIDERLLANLNRLQVLLLANNQLQFGENNFKANINLIQLDLSGNGLQYLPNKLFANLHELVSIDLSNNNLQTINACTFNKLLINPLAKKYFPTQVNLLGNPIECNCDIFYINRYLKIQLNLTCARPEFYSGKQFKELSAEDPSERCNYKQMDKLCKIAANEDDSWLISLVVIVLLILATLLFLLISIMCLMRNVSLNKKLKALQSDAKSGRNEQATLLNNRFVCNGSEPVQQQTASVPAPAPTAAQTSTEDHSKSPKLEQGDKTKLLQS